MPAIQETQFDSWVGKIPWRREWLQVQYSLPGESMDRGAWQAIVHGDHKKSDTTEGLTLPLFFHFFHML